jgi:uncharacterized membrane protein
MAINIAGKSMSYAAIVAAVGGILAIVGAALTWISVSAGGATQDTSGLDSKVLGGKVALVLGILVLAVVAAGILNIKIPQSSLILVVLGAAILVVVALVYFTKILSDSSFVDIADSAKKYGGSASLGIGAFAEIAAGILAIVGGGWALLKKS